MDRLEAATLKIEPGWDLDPVGRGSVETRCQTCGRRVHRPPAAKPATFCSRRCQAKRTSSIGRCGTCGGMFGYKRSQLRAYPNAGRYCSRECAEAVPGICAICGIEIEGHPSLKYCEEHAKKGYLLMDPLTRKAWSLSANVLGGKGKRERMIELLRQAVGASCVYCGVEVTIETASLDHKEPINSSGARRHKALSREVRLHADRWDNLQIICVKCNTRKGNFTDGEFRQLMDACTEAMWSKLEWRLRLSGFGWRR